MSPSGCGQGSRGATPSPPGTAGTPPYREQAVSCESRWMRMVVPSPKHTRPMRMPPALILLIMSSGSFISIHKHSIFYVSYFFIFMPLSCLIGLFSYIQVPGGGNDERMQRWGTYRGRARTWRRRALAGETRGPEGAADLQVFVSREFKGTVPPRTLRRETHPHPVSPAGAGNLPAWAGGSRAENGPERSFSTNSLAPLVVPDDPVFRSLRELILSAHQDIFGPVATVQHLSRDTIPSASAREHHRQQHQPCVFPHRLPP